MQEPNENTNNKEFEKFKELIKNNHKLENSPIAITVDITTQNNPALKIMEDYGYTKERSQREETLRIWEEHGRKKDISGLNTFDFNIYYNQDEGKYKLKTKNNEYMDLSVTELETIYNSSIRFYQIPIARGKIE